MVSLNHESFSMTQNLESIKAKTDKTNDKLAIDICHSYHKVLKSPNLECLWNEKRKKGHQPIDKWQKTRKERSQEGTKKGF